MQMNKEETHQFKCPVCDNESEHTHSADDKELVAYWEKLKKDKINKPKQITIK